MPHCATILRGIAPRASASPVFLVIAALALLATACGGSAGPTASEGAPPPTSSRQDCGGPQIKGSAETPLCAGSYLTPAGFRPPLAVVLPEPSGNLKWFGGAFSTSDVQIREGERSCDGCELGVLELVSVPSEAAAIDEFRSLEKLSNFTQKPATVLGLPATEVSATLNGDLYHVFGGIEWGPGAHHVYLMTSHNQTFVAMFSGEDPAAQADMQAIRLSAAR